MVNEGYHANWNPNTRRGRAFPRFGIDLQYRQDYQPSRRSLQVAKTRTFAQTYLQPYRIVMRLRALRTQKGLTLSRLAAETSLSTALLSKLETETMTPTLQTL